MSLVSRSLRISSQMLESFDLIQVKKRCQSGLRFGLRVGCDLGCVAKVGCDPVLLGCDLGSMCVCVCVCFFFCDQWLKEEVGITKLGMGLIWMVAEFYLCSFFLSL